jgi:hypothetical protein|tara:strand:- start:2455 stop:2682 length:228 start_codon:yes stop_codon:yes gene_type:complete
MMVIKGTIAVTASGFTAGTQYNLPAEDCTWVTTAATGGGYELTSARFIKGSIDFLVVGPVLGVIGKTGRFVAITN